jgi:hypothetical protein
MGLFKYKGRAFAMKSIIHAAAVAALLSAPVFAFAQSNEPVTRAEVKGELTQLERAGYSPANDEANYPTNLQAAEARVNTSVASQSGRGVNTDGYGGTLSRSSETGTRRALPGDRSSIYFGD